MSESKHPHTPGPWRVVAGKFGLQIHSEKHWLANMKCESCPVQEEDNARLIAAAPDMLAALRLLDARGFTTATWDLCVKAIAKAEGRS